VSGNRCYQQLTTTSPTCGRDGRLEQNQTYANFGIQKAIAKTDKRSSPDVFKFPVALDAEIVSKATAIMRLKQAFPNTHQAPIRGQTIPIRRAGMSSRKASHTNSHANAGSCSRNENMKPKARKLSTGMRSTAAMIAATRRTLKTGLCIKGIHFMATLGKGVDKSRYRK
jgi:hypothetical protein